MDNLRDMLRDIELEAALTCHLTGHLTGRDRLDERVMAAMARVPRAEFLPEETRFLAYRDGPAPIGHGQTISQPFIVALMTDLLQPRSDAVILEVGSGSGYQAAVLAELVARVYSLEIVAPLAASAAATLARLGYANVEVRQGDGYGGWPEHAPYDGIIVTAAAPHVPAPLAAQLKSGGRLVIPLGPPGGAQELHVLEKSKAGTMREWKVLDVVFVPLTGPLGLAGPGADRGVA